MYVCGRSRSRRHDVLDDVLVENEELERQEGSDEQNNGSVHATSTRKDSAPTRVHTRQLPSNNEASLSTSADGSRVTSVIMMYSPDIPSLDGHQQHHPSTSASSRSTDIGNYYLRIDAEETAKCVVTSVLFCAVIILIVLVAVLKNPGM